MKTRLQAIDYLKCFACILIVNSHCAALYPSSLSILAFGGYFGNCIFFLVAGFNLLNIQGSFPVWYWRKFVRVYVPYLLSIPLLFFDNRFEGNSLVEIFMPFHIYYFIPTILILYIAFFLSVFLEKKRVKFWYQILFLLILLFVYFFTLYDIEKGDIYEYYTPLTMSSYLISMMLGACLKKYGVYKRWSSVLLVTVSFVLYVYQSVFGFPKYLSVFQLLIGICFACGCGSLLIGLESKLKDIKVIRAISSVTLEVYIVHFVCVDAFKNIGFPTNILFFACSAVAVASCLHVVSERITKFLVGFKWKRIKDGA